jgi:hypothetical protein
MNAAPYVLTLHPGANVEVAVARAARYIIDRWMPGNAGGVVLLLGPQLCGLLHPIWQRANQTRRPINLRVELIANRPYVTEVP